MRYQQRKQGRQARAQATEAAIIEAAARILENEGSEALTTNRIAERAGVSIGSLYQYFPNKQAVLVALLRREWGVLLADVLRVAESHQPPREALLRLIDVAIAHQFARPKLALELEHLEQTLALGPEMEALATRLAKEIAGSVQAYDPASGIAAAEDVVTICRALTNAAALKGERDVAVIRRRVERAVFGYLDGPGQSD